MEFLPPFIYDIYGRYFIDASGNPVTQSVVGVTDSSGNPVTGNIDIKYIDSNFFNLFIVRDLMFFKHFTFIRVNKSYITFEI